MPELVEPTTDLYESWRAAHEEWGPGKHEDGFGFGPDDATDTAGGFAAWVARLHRSPDLSWWIVENNAVAGGIALRLQTSYFLRSHGHIGYGIRPSARGRGLATWALGEALSIARSRGLAEVLLVCDAANGASARVIERNGGQLEAPGQSDEGGVRRYRISLMR